MSVLEKEKKAKLDDTVPLKCSIDGFLNKDGHTEFIMKVQRGANTDHCWQVQHRYSEFATLHSQLTYNLVGFELSLPPKKAFGNMDSTFIQERRIGLQNFIDSVLSHSLFNSHILVKKFLDPTNYSDKIEATAQQQAAMFFRSEPNWELQENLKEIGWRVRKHFFSLKSKDGNKSIKHILSYVEHGPAMVLEYDSSLLAVLKQITSLKHPFIYPTIYASCTDKGGTIVRQFHPSGSLRDVLCKAKPALPRLKKYGNFKLRIPLDIPDIKRIGRQVLEALKFLKDKGLPYGHLHAGNVIIDGQDCRLLDIENGILGLPSLYRPFLTQIKSIKEMESIDVYCFGQFLYEITFGVALDLPSVENLPNNCPPMLQPVLHSILSNTAVKNGLPSIDDLITNPFFSDIQISFGGEKPSFKVSKLKESLRQAKEAIETKLREDQKTYRQLIRLSKARSELMSDEEKRKRKKSSKKKTSKQEDRSKSPTSPTSSKPPAVPAPPSVPTPPPAPPPKVNSQPAHTKQPPPQQGRGALLSSIGNFKKGGLKKTQTNDRSAPKL